MKSVHFCIATHNHQPIGNFDYVIEEAYEKSYLPFFKLAEKFDFRFATHFSGILLEWLGKHHPEQLALLRSLVEKGRLEIISGGYYEPILAVFSEKDRRTQITKLSAHIKKTFGSVPQGMWLAERIWEQQLASTLSDAKIKYTILDDTHFRGAGLEEEDLTGYYLTEDQGNHVAVFPISKELRYTIPFASVDETIRILRDASSESGKNIITFADDGEKFGVWPKTFQHVYKDGWLEEFFRKLDENSSWLRTTHFSEVIKTVPPKGTIYLPNGSYAEMMQWALPTAKANLKYEQFVTLLSENEEEWKEYGQFVRGGFWRNFFVKYPESNHLHKRVLDVSKRFASCKTSLTKSKKYQAAYDHLLAAQCNDPYWHGVFGGIYLANLRHEVYSHLIAAENGLSEIEKKDVLSCTTSKSDEITIENKDLRITIDPQRGGAISEIDFKPKSFNLSNFMNRIVEPSHEKLHAAQDEENSGMKSRSIHDVVLTKEKGLEEYLIYDWYRHGSFVEHFLSREATLKDLQKMTFLEHGDFFKTHIKPEVTVSETTVTVEFRHEGSVNFDNVNYPVTLKKSLRIEKISNSISAHINLTNNSAEDLPFRFASEWTFGMLAGDAEDRYYESEGVEIKNKKMNSTGEIRNSMELALIDEWTGVTIAIGSEKKCTFWRTPIETVSLSEAGFERVYQGSIIFALWDLSLKPGETWDVKLAIRVASI
ncbi:MAG: alpha-amylase/4-alpha-glucanotransferase domain-containing protein [Candidatus Kapaibacterium sp.]